MALDFHAQTIATYRGFRIGLIRTPAGLVVTARGPGLTSLMQVGPDEKELIRHVRAWIDGQHHAQRSLAAAG